MKRFLILLLLFPTSIGICSPNIMLPERMTVQAPETTNNGYTISSVNWGIHSSETLNLVNSTLCIGWTYYRYIGTDHIIPNRIVMDCFEYIHHQGMEKFKLTVSVVRTMAGTISEYRFAWFKIY